jgi:hypothetical protein
MHVWFILRPWQYNQDTCGKLQVWTEPGLGSGLRITREDEDRAPILYLHVNPGLLHIAHFYCLGSLENGAGSQARGQVVSSHNCHRRCHNVSMLCV